MYHYFFSLRHPRAYRQQSSYSQLVSATQLQLCFLDHDDGDHLDYLCF
nr:MAG TPA: Schwannomin-interacting protein 1 [Caudoviricetes sp.]